MLQISDNISTKKPIYNNDIGLATQPLKLDSNKEFFIFSKVIKIQFSDYSPIKFCISLSTTSKIFWYNNETENNNSIRHDAKLNKL